MASPAGFSGQLGYKTEVTVGTAVTVDEFLPVDSTSIKQNIERLESTGARAGRRVLAAWKAGQQAISGNIEMDLWNVDVAPLWKHAFGAVSTSGAGPYTHTYTPGDLTGDSFTAQVGIPDTAGTVDAFTYAGCKISDWTIAADVGSIAKLSLGIVAMSETTATALATASYGSTLAPFVFTEATLTLAGSSVGTVKSVQLTGNNGLTERFRLGSATSKEYLENVLREYTGTITTDFDSLTAYARFTAASESALVLAFSNGTQTLTFTCNVRYDGETPELNSTDLAEQMLPFKCVSGTSDAAAITAVLVNTDVTAT